MTYLFPRKYKKDVYFLFAAGEKWNAAKYLMKNRRGTIQMQVVISSIHKN